MIVAGSSKWHGKNICRTEGYTIQIQCIAYFQHDKNNIITTICTKNLDDWKGGCPPLTDGIGRFEEASSTKSLGTICDLTDADNEDRTDFGTSYNTRCVIELCSPQKTVWEKIWA